MKVAAFTQGRKQPGARFRVRQHLHRLAELGICVDEFCPRLGAYTGIPARLARLPRPIRLPVVAALQGYKLGARLSPVLAARRYDRVWLHREFVPGYATLEVLLAANFVFDVDDAIWLATQRSPGRIAKIASRAGAILAGNSYLAEWFDQYCQRVHIVPTAVDTKRFCPPLQCREETDPFVVGWIGTSSNLPYVDTIAPALNRFLDTHSHAVLQIVSDQVPKLPNIAERRVRFVPWSEAAEVSLIQNMDVGIMPLPDTPWTRGKCSFKMLQYMACAKPVVVSPVGMNREVLAEGRVGFGAETLDDWVDALSALYVDRNQGRDLGQGGREVVQKKYCSEVVVQAIAKVLKEL